MVRKKLYKYIEIILGMIIIAIAFDLFINPLKIAVGGTNGLAVVISAIFDINASTFILAFYAFALILNLIIFKVKGTKSVVLGSIAYPIFVKIFSDITTYISLDYSNKLLMYLFAAVLLGLGNGLVYKHGYICGGMDVIKKILNEKIKISMGTATLIIDGIIVLSGGFIFGLESILYAIIIVYISSKITDKVILGISNEKMFYIMTDKPDEVRKCITFELKCGITELEGIGGYTNSKNHILMVVISTRDYIKLEKKVNEIDEFAFFLITDSYHMYHGSVKYGTNKDN